MNANQPIFSIKKTTVKEIVEVCNNHTPIPSYWEWGEARSIEQVMNGIDTIPCQGEYIKMHDLHAYFQSIETHKIPAYANRMIKRVLAKCKTNREDLNKIDHNNTNK